MVRKKGEGREEAKEGIEPRGEGNNRMLLLLLLPVLFRIQREEKKIPTPLFPEKKPDSKYGKKVAGKNRYCTAEVNLETKAFFMSVIVVIHSEWRRLSHHCLLLFSLFCR